MISCSEPPEKRNFSPWEGEMAWVTPKYRRAQVDAAGESLLESRLPRDEYFNAMEIIDNWRMSHQYPLQIIKMSLLRRAVRIEAKALVYQRTKRLASIESKLKRYPLMKLSQMQDLGGCRAVLATSAEVAKLATSYERQNNIYVKRKGTDKPVAGSELFKSYDYIERPKSDGYRSLHLVYKYHTKDHRVGASYENLRIEIQIRSRLQHAWASAVETVDLFTHQALKSNEGGESTAPGDRASVRATSDRETAQQLYRSCQGS